MYFIRIYSIYIILFDFCFIIKFFVLSFVKHIYFICFHDVIWMMLQNTKFVIRTVKFLLYIIHCKSLLLFFYILSKSIFRSIFKTRSISNYTSKAINRLKISDFHFPGISCCDAYKVDSLLPYCTIIFFYLTSIPLKTQSLKISILFWTDYISSL